MNRIIPPLSLVAQDHVYVLRGDRLMGGLKRPALVRYLPSLGTTRFAYVGTVYGSGAWGMAEACADLGYQCSLFLAQSKYRPSWLDRLTQLRCNVYWEKPEPVAHIHERVNRLHPDLCNLPLGFDTPEFVAAMADALKDCVLQNGPAATHPPEIWVPALSGVLARATCLAFPDTPVHAVSAAKHVGDIGRAILHTAPQKFHIPAMEPPPYPACPFSDAKVWQFAKKLAVPGAFLWNVSQ